MSRRLSVSVMLGTTLLVGVTACGSDSGGSTSPGSGGNATVSIVEPADGSALQIPFMLKVDSSASLGSTESGQHHVHLYFDGDDSKYEVVESDSMEIGSSSKAVAGLMPGKHELNVSLRNADHSPAGAETKIMVEVGGGAGAEPPSKGDGGGGGY